MVGGLPLQSEQAESQGKRFRAVKTKTPERIWFLTAERRRSATVTGERLTCPKGKRSPGWVDVFAEVGWKRGGLMSGIELATAWAASVKNEMAGVNTHIPSELQLEKLHNHGGSEWAGHRAW